MLPVGPARAARRLRTADGARGGRPPGANPARPGTVVGSPDDPADADTAEPTGSGPVRSTTRSSAGAPGAANSGRSCSRDGRADVSTRSGMSYDVCGSDMALLPVPRGAGGRPRPPGAPVPDEPAQGAGDR